jgi:type III secretory pathway lipoprotein EscJ
MLIVIKSYLTPAEAHAMQSLLESQGVFCVLKDEDTIVMMPYLANAIQGVQVVVHETDVEQALTILKEAGFIKPETEEKGFFKENKGLLIVAFILLLFFLYHFLKTVPGFSLW